MAATYGAPGVYIEEQPSGSMPIQGVGTSVAAFVGFTAALRPRQRRPHRPRRGQAATGHQLAAVRADLRRLRAGAMLPHAVRGFFENGGGACYIVRIPAGGRRDAPPMLALPAAEPTRAGSFTVHALKTTASRPRSRWCRPPPRRGRQPGHRMPFTLRVYSGGEMREELSGISFGKAPRTVEKTVNERSSSSFASRSPASPGRIARRAAARARPLHLGRPARRRRPSRTARGIGGRPHRLPGPGHRRQRHHGGHPRPDHRGHRRGRHARRGDVPRRAEQLVDWCEATPHPDGHPGHPARPERDPGPGVAGAAGPGHRRSPRCYYPNVVVPNRAAARRDQRRAS